MRILTNFGKATTGTMGCKACGAEPLHEHKDGCPRVVTITLPWPKCSICGEDARVDCLWCEAFLCGGSSCTVKHGEREHNK